MKRFLLIISGLLILSLAAWGVHRLNDSRALNQKNQRVKPKPLVVTQAVQTGEISSTLELTGSIEATRVARLASPAEGPVCNCNLREGDPVKEGEKVLSIGRKKATEALLLSAKQDVKTEQEELARIEQLVESGAIPKDQLDLARTKYHRATAQREKVKESSDDYDITAPWDGIISKVMVADGNYVVPRTVMVEIFDPKSLVVRTAVPEGQSQELRLGMDVAVKLDAYKGKAFGGKISRIYPELDRRMRTRAVEVEVVDPVDLVPGMFARLSLNLRTLKDALAVPSEAVIVTPKGLRVAYVIEEGKALQRKITTGIEGGGNIEILSGIKAGEQIVVAGNEKLKDGMEIRLPGAGKKDAEAPKPQAGKDKGDAGR
ncbi:MAG: efflux RND transporter periplasmic adaptor subunit [Desulfomonile tiedjei]|nr:efflux RND transporter periplasmic adaptor subunit [Desulfomonile tiedjei]